MTEAMACGTPVLALPNGSVPEVMSGFPQLICRSVEEMTNKLIHETLPDPYELREYVLEHFTTSGMTDKYLEIYQATIEEES
ncbi:hypothetical protein D3C71_2022650 [compost metagenome]